MDVIRKNILEIEKGLICHQVNCKGVMGAGLAFSIRRKWPYVYDAYRYAFKKNQLKLGFVQIASVDNLKFSQMVSIDAGIMVANLCGQDGYGRGKRYTDYRALRTCLQAVARFNSISIPAIYIPYKMGCGYAGGDWNIVEKIIEEEIPDAIICKWER